MGKYRKINRLVIAVVVCSLFLLANNVKADPQPSGTTWIGIIAGIGLEITSIVFAVGNLRYALDREKPSSGWRTGAYIVGGFNMGVGILGLIYVGSNDSEFGGDYWWLIAACIGITAVGAMDIGFAIWSNSQPERPQQELTLSPMIMPDIRGRPAVGVGLRLVDW